MKNQQWELKYKDLKLKFHDAVDVAFRLGYEQGAQNAQVQQVQQQQMQAINQPGYEVGQDPNSPESPDGSELDHHIGQLESMLGSGGGTKEMQEGLEKSLQTLKEIKANLKISYDMKKNEKSPFVLGKAASKNMSETAKKALTMQEQIVSDLMKSMEEEEKKAAEAITKTLDLEQILKG